MAYLSRDITGRTDISSGRRSPSPASLPYVSSSCSCHDTSLALFRHHCLACRLTFVPALPLAFEKTSLLPGASLHSQHRFVPLYLPRSITLLPAYTLSTGLPYWHLFRTHGAARRADDAHLFCRAWRSLFSAARARADVVVRGGGIMAALARSACLAFAACRILVGGVENSALAYGTRDSNSRIIISISTSKKNHLVDEKDPMRYPRIAGISGRSTSSLPSRLPGNRTHNRRA